MAGRDHARGRIDTEEYRWVVEALRDLAEALVPAAEGEPTHRVFGAPARGPADAVGLVSLRDLLVPARVALDVASPDLLSAEIVGAVRDHGADVVVVGSLPPGGVAQARYLCKRLRAAVPGIRIVVGRLGGGEEVEAVGQALLAAGADAVGTDLTDTRDKVLQFVRVRPEVEPQHVA
jgi:hypothetical protein